MALYYSIGAALNDDTTGTEPIDWRKTLEGLVTSVGVLPGADSPLVSGVSGEMKYRVGVATWATPEGASGGVHLWGNDGAYDVTTDAAPGSGLSRIDIIYAMHTSNGENGATASTPTVDVEIGTPASSPIAPAIPPNAIELARNTMTSAATDTAGTGNTIAQTATQAVLVGTDWQDYAPTLTHIALGNGSRSGRYRLNGSTVEFSVFVTAGSTTVVDGVVQIGLPVAAASAAMVSGAGYRSNPNGGLIFRGTTTTSVFLYDAATGTAWNTGVDFGDTDTIRISGFYERA